MATTWERAGYPDIPLLDYLSHALIVKDEIEILKNTKWEMDRDKWIELFSTTNLILSPDEETIRGFDYLNYLRQHGFPSPLLDRTRSIFVAAFFTFQNIAEKRNGAAIYVLMRVNVDSKVPMDFRQYLGFVLAMVGTVGILCSKVNTRFLRIGRSTKHEERGGHDWYIASHETSITESERL